LKGSEVKKLLRANDCYLYREGSRHEIWISRRTGKKFQVPRHDSQDVPKGTFQEIKRVAGIE
jgi:predicted RNA binding protein YcfA (HicA-like mRNA interferase family)